MLGLLLLACESDAPPSPAPAQCLALAEQVDPARLEAHVRALAALPRRSGPERAAARELLRLTLEQQGQTPKEQPFTLEGISGVNLVLSAGSPILVAAHYDAVQGTPGADDNASGVAVALEVARLLGDRVDVVFFDLEEYVEPSRPELEAGFLLGSRAFVEAGGRPDLTIVLDTVAFGCDACQRVPAGVPDAVKVDGQGLYLVADSGGPWAAFEAHFNQGTRRHAAYRFEVPLSGRGIPDSRRSDHSRFWDADLHAVLITDTANLRNPSYHLPSDTPDTLSPTMLADAARGVVVAACAAAAAR